MPQKTRDQYHRLIGKKLEHIRHLKRELALREAQIDALMLEFCPDEMTAQQRKRWALHQRPVRSR